MPLLEDEMTRRLHLIALAGLLTLGLTGCHVMRHKGGPVDRAKPQVGVVDGKITIDQEVLYFPAGQGPVTITWTLDPKSGYEFDPKIGIIFDPRAENEIVNCRRSDKSPLVFTCDNRHSRRGYYKYDINVRTPDGKSTIGRDPFVMNN